MSEKTIKFSRNGKAYETELPRDVAEFAAGGKALDISSVQRDAMVRAFMKERPDLNYYQAFHVVLLGADPGDVVSLAEESNPTRKRSRTIAAIFGWYLGGTRAMK